MTNHDNRTYLPRTQIEIINPDLRRGPFRQVIFDFDGTVSLIREGWQQVMASMMTEILLTTPQAEDEITLHERMREFVAQTTGQQTILQMAGLAEAVEQRGGEAKDPQLYKQEFLKRLASRIDRRIAAIKSGQVEPAEMVVPGVLDILPTLRRQGLTCYLASGTDEKSVIKEAKLLGVADYFNGGIYGARDDGQAVSKKMLIQRILSENNQASHELLVFGDGRDEITHAAAAGCIAVGVASNEAERRGINEAKRDQLIQVGADLIIPDFRDYEILLDYLTGA